MQRNSKLIRFVFVSPPFLLLFAIIPGMLIFSRFFHLHLPFSMSTKMLLANNIFLLMCLATRLYYYLTGLRRPIRYGSEPCIKGPSIDLTRSTAQVRGDLAAAGFCFDAEQNYGEKHNSGHLGVTLVYGGLCLMLLTGVWDNLRQFSGTVLKGSGKPVELSVRDDYYHLIAGPLASPAGLPLMKVLKQTFPNSQLPLGSSEIALYAKDGKRVGGATLVPGEAPYRYKEFEIYTGRLAVDYALTLRTKDSANNNVFDDAVKLYQLPATKDGFTHYGTFTTPAGDEGETWYDPVKNTFRIVLARNGKKIIDTDFIFQAYREKLEGDYVIGVKGMGHWSEIHIVGRRHMPLIIASGIVALIGVLMRMLFRPQRVWLKETPEGCRVRVVGKNPLKVEG